MRKLFVVTIAVCLYQASAFAEAPGASIAIPAECKNLALMQAQLLNTRFNDGQMTGRPYNPAKLTLKTENGYRIGKVEYLGGDSQDDSGPNVGKYPCDLDQSLCTNPADAGGSIDWARVSVVSGSGADSFVAAKVVVSMGSRGGCSLSSAQYPSAQ